MNQNGDGSLHKCPKCRRTFRRLATLNEHSQMCEQTEEARRQQCTVHRAAELAFHIVYGGSLEHDTIYNPLGN